MPESKETFVVLFDVLGTICTWRLRLQDIVDHIIQPLSEEGVLFGALSDYTAKDERTINFLDRLKDIKKAELFHSVICRDSQDIIAAKPHYGYVLEALKAMKDKLYGDTIVVIVGDSCDDMKLAGTAAGNMEKIREQLPNVKSLTFHAIGAAWNGGEEWERRPLIAEIGPEMVVETLKQLEDKLKAMLSRLSTNSAISRPQMESIPG